MQTFPSQEFADKTGLGWLFTEWKLPGTADDTYERMSKASDAMDQSKESGASDLLSLYMEILSLNPELQELPEPKSWKQLLDVIHGAISKFNYDDIAFFSASSFESILKYNRSTVEDRRKVISKHFGMYPQWVMSPKTLERVERTIKKK